MALHILVTILLISSVNSLPSKLMPAKILKATPVNGNLQRLGEKPFASTIMILLFCSK